MKIKHNTFTKKASSKHSLSITCLTTCPCMPQHRPYAKKILELEQLIHFLYHLLLLSYTLQAPPHLQLHHTQNSHDSPGCRWKGKRIHAPASKTVYKDFLMMFVKHCFSTFVCLTLPSHWLLYLLSWFSKSTIPILPPLCCLAIIRNFVLTLTLLPGLFILCLILY